MPGTSLAESIAGDWAVSIRSLGRGPGPAGERVPVGRLRIGPGTYRFTREPGASIPGKMARRVVFLVRPSGALSIRFAAGIDPDLDLAQVLALHPARLLAHLTFGDRGGENEYAVVSAGEGLGLGLAPMFHVALGINEPPLVQKPGPA